MCRVPVTLLIMTLSLAGPAIAGETGDSSKATFDANKSQNPDASSPKSFDPSALLFPAGQFQIGAFGTGGFGHGTENVTEEHIVHQTITVPETHFVTQYQTQLIPQTTYQTKVTPGYYLPYTAAYVYVPAKTTTVPVTTYVPVTTSVSVPVTTTHQVVVSHVVKTTKNVSPIQGGFGGAGADAGYFFTRNLGLGITGDWLDGKGSSGTTMATVTVRFPVKALAYYVIGGSGTQFDGNRTQAIGELGAGIERDFALGTGVYAEGAWMFGANENAAVFHAGFRWGF
jgi:hypothetical protein